MMDDNQDADTLIQSLPPLQASLEYDAVIPYDGKNGLLINLGESRSSAIAKRTIFLGYADGPSDIPAPIHENQQQPQTRLRGLAERLRSFRNPGDVIAYVNGKSTQGLSFPAVLQLISHHYEHEGRQRGFVHFRMQTAAYAALMRHNPPTTVSTAPSSDLTTNSREDELRVETANLETKLEYAQSARQQLLTTVHNLSKKVERHTYELQEKREELQNLTGGASKATRGSTPRKAVPHSNTHLSNKRRQTQALPLRTKGTWQTQSSFPYPQPPRFRPPSIEQDLGPVHEQRSTKRLRNTEPEPFDC
mmetsp:Transcript_3922/g.10694  ORF Transcript_3922/g.10694 Transcript_3922/m.10694 type:complete len:305 (-) Transcript_3922:103-1017(-)